MRAHRLLAAAALLLLPLAGCSSIIAPGTVQVRFRNETTWHITQLTFAPPDPAISVDRLEPGEVSGYLNADGAYSYGALHLLADGVPKGLQPIDFVGEETLRGGHYTYVISSIGGNVQLTLQKD